MEVSDIITTRDAGNLDLLVAKIAGAAEQNGWHDRYHELLRAGDVDAVREFVITKVMLVVSELSEAVEELRNGHEIRETYYSEGGKPEGFPVEVADALIRICDLAGMVGLNLGKQVRTKLRHNASRGRMHGGKVV